MNQVPRLTQTNKILLIISLFFFLLGSIAYQWMNIPVTIYLGLGWEGIAQGRIYQFLTYPFWQAGLFPFLFQSLLLWWTGGDLESHWGTKFYRFFVASTLIVMGLLFIVLSLVFNATGIMQGSTLVGMSGLTFALLFAYASIFPDRQFSFLMLFPMKAWHFCLLLGAIELYQILFSPFGAALWGHLIGAGWGIFLLKYLSWRSRRGPTKTRSQRNAEVLRKSFKVIKSGQDEPKNTDPKYWH